MTPQKQTNNQQTFLFPGLNGLCDPKHPLRQLGEKIEWKRFEEAFAGCYSQEGRPAKPIRLMVGLLLLKQIYNVSDERVVESWKENIYWQHFCGYEEVQWALPCDASDLVYFRNRIGEKGAGVLFAYSAQLHGKKVEEPEIIIDSTVQEKNITYPTDAKQYRKIISRCWKLADKNGIKLRRRYRKDVRKSLLAQRHRKNNKQAASSGQRRLRTIAGILIRELERKLPQPLSEEHKEKFSFYRKILAQKKQDTQKIYSLHEPHIYCMSKGKEHKKYEFGTKASLAITKTHQIIVAAIAHPKNIYDAHTLPHVLNQVETISTKRPQLAIADKGYKGKKLVGTTQILIPGKPPKNQSSSEKTKIRKCFRRRAAIEPVISHLKHHFRLFRCFLKGVQGDQINLMMAATAWNLRKWMQQVSLFWLRFLLSLFARFSSFSSPYKIFSP